MTLVSLSSVKLIHMIASILLRDLIDYLSSCWWLNYLLYIRVADNLEVLYLLMRHILRVRILLVIALLF